MLYDPKWEAKAKPPISSVAGLVAWLETQNPDKYYNWLSCNGECLIGLYAAAMGMQEHALHSEFFRRDELHIACTRPWTLGAALERARAALSIGFREGQS